MLPLQVEKTDQQHLALQYPHEAKKLGEGSKLDLTEKQH